MVDDLGGAVGTLAMTVPLSVLARTASNVATNKNRHHHKVDLDYHTRTPRVKTKYYDRYGGD